MTTIDIPGIMPGSRVSTIETAGEVGRRLAILLVGVAYGLVRTMTPHLFTIAGFAALCAAAFTISLTLGLAAVGLSLFLTEWKIRQ